MIDLPGLALSHADKVLLAHPLVGGVILFARNYASPEQLKALTAGIRALRPQLWIAVDQEGGRVVRFKQGFRPLHAMRHFGELYDTNPEQAVALLRAQTLQMASELRSVGVHFSFVPVLDIDWGLSSVIGDRSFHRDPEVLCALAGSMVDALHEAGMPAVGKHFPGHGGIAADSHLRQCEDQRGWDEISAHDLMPYRRLMTRLDAVMSAHVTYPKMDTHPASLSAFWLKKVLRDQMGFKGMVFTDDLSMKGVQQLDGTLARVERALDAGNDMLLLCNDRQAVIEVLESGLEASLSVARAKQFRRW